MPLRWVRASTADALWAACVDRFLDAAVSRPGPRDHGAWIWLTHRSLRDRLLQEAARRGCPGWLDPPVSFFSELPQRFGIAGRAAGLLTRRQLVSQIAGRRGQDLLGRDPDLADGVLRQHAIDSLFGELLPEGVDPGRLRAALDRLGGDEFARARNRWIAESYAEYLQVLQRRGEYDDRAVHARIAERIHDARLQSVLGGARELHVYGMASLQHRMQLLRALAEQSEVLVYVYMVREPEPGELQELATEIEDLEEESVATPAVQPAPDATREAEWVARRIKQILWHGEVAPHEVAVVARSGGEDTRRLARALRSYGVPVTVRTRTPLSEVPALRALVSLFQGAVRGWDVRSLRPVLTSPYLKCGVDVRGLDHIAHERQVEGLEAWCGWLQTLADEVRRDPRRFAGTGLFADRLERDRIALEALRELLEPLARPRDEKAWIELTYTWLRDGVLGLRECASQEVEGRWDIVRADQRGIVQLQRLLAEWLALEHPGGEIDVSTWHRMLRRLLRGSELGVSSLQQLGVQVLEAHEAALVPHRHLFLVHANDGEFPRAAGTGGLIGDRDSTRLREAGIPLADRDTRLRRERALWRAVVAQRGVVTVVYRTTGSGGTPLLPSLMVPAHAPESELSRTRVPEPDRVPMAPFEADRIAARRIGALVPGGALPVVAPADRERLQQACLAAIVESQRALVTQVAEPAQAAARPHPWNGWLRSAEVREHLRERFGEGAVWSASALEKYGAWPFRFLLDNVLRVRDLQPADIETSPLISGSVQHEILERFYREFLEGLPEELTEAASHKLDEIADAVFERWQSSNEWLGLPLLWEQQRERIRQGVREFLRWELPYLQEHHERPVLLEERFGEQEPTLVRGRALDESETVLALRGRIDRVDERASGKGAGLYVLDYKRSKTPSPAGYDDGGTLQSVLYVVVLQQRGMSVRGAYYRSIERPHNRARSAAVSSGGSKFERALSLALSIPARVRAGLFEASRAASAGKARPWEPGLEISRCSVLLARGTSRFDVGAGIAEANDA